MKTLVVENDNFRKRLLVDTFNVYGDVDVAKDGREAIGYFVLALERGVPYDLACIDNYLPEIGGNDIKKEIRKIEQTKGIESTAAMKIILLSALVDSKILLNVDDPCETHVEKPVDPKKLTAKLRSLGLLKPANA